MSSSSGDNDTPSQFECLGHRNYLLKRHAAHQQQLRRQLKDKQFIGPKESLLAFRLMRDAFDEEGGLAVFVPRLRMTLAQYATLSVL